MSEAQLKTYRLTSLEEPSDEMLNAIMEKVAEEARASSARVEELHHQRLIAIAAMRVKNSKSAQ